MWGRLPLLLFHPTSLPGDWCGENLTVSIKPMDPLHPTPLTWDCPKVEPHVGHQN